MSRERNLTRSRRRGPQPPNRRQVLSAGVTAASIAISGCLSTEDIIGTSSKDEYEISDQPFVFTGSGWGDVLQADSNVPVALLVTSTRGAEVLQLFGLDGYAAPTFIDTTDFSESVLLFAQFNPDPDSQELVVSDIQMNDGFIETTTEFAGIDRDEPVDDHARFEARLPRLSELIRVPRMDESVRALVSFAGEDEVEAENPDMERISVRNEVAVIHHDRLDRGFPRGRFEQHWELAVDPDPTATTTIQFGTPNVETRLDEIYWILSESSASIETSIAIQDDEGNRLAEEQVGLSNGRYAVFGWMEPGEYTIHLESAEHSETFSVRVSPDTGLGGAREWSVLLRDDGSVDRFASGAT